MEKMYPSAEFENYKLQVELLQEKLQRSEENRHQLEHKLEQILQKRSEHDKSVRAKARLKYQEFLEEQQKRNERNKLLVKMLERVDEQSAVLSARSERLKMMKMQYEMYFAKLVQSQTMRCIQNSAVAATTPSAIPVLLPRATATPAPGTASGPTELAIKMNEPAATDSRATYQIDVNNTLPGHPAATTTTATLCLTPGNNFNELQLTMPQRQWTLAMATPTPAGMLLTTNPTTTATTGLLEYDYLKYPIGYLPAAQMHFAYQQHAAATAAAAAAYSAATAGIDDDLLSTQRSSGGGGGSRAATLDEIGRPNNNKNNNDLERNQQMRPPSIVENNDIDTSTAAAKAGVPDPLNFNKISMHSGVGVDAIMPPTTMATKQAASSPTASTASATATSTSLTFDELPHGKSKSTEEALGGNVGVAAAAAYTDYNNSNNIYNNSETNLQDFANVSGGSGDGAGGGNYTNHYRNSAETFEKPLNGKRAVNEVDVLGVAAADDVANLLRRQKIDDARAPFQQRAPTTFGKDNANDSGSNITNDINTLTPDKRYEPRSYYDDTFGSDNSKKNGEATAATPAAGSYKPLHFERKEKMSIENIENEFYGELVKPPISVEGKSALAVAPEQHVASAALTATSELLDELTATKPAAAAAVAATLAITENAAAAAEIDYAVATSAEQQPATDYDANFAYPQEGGYVPTEGEDYSAASEAYAAETYQQQENMPYSGEVDPATQDYQQYEAAADPNLAENQDYDYQQYDAAAYQNAYDPNAYPGYTYDETTGQYTADPNQQYEAAEGAYTEADYAAQQEVYDEAQQQQQEQQQQEALPSNYDYAQYQQQQEATDATSVYAEPTQNETVEQTPATVANESSTHPTTTPTGAASNAEVPVTPTQPTSGTTTKPTSILAHSTDGAKAAANEAQQQKKKKRVNFVDSSETDDSSTVKPDGAAGAGEAAAAARVAVGESDFDFSSSSAASGVINN